MDLEFVTRLAGGFRLYLNDDNNYVLVDEENSTIIGISDYKSLVAKKDGHIISDGSGNLGIADLYGNIIVPCEYDIFCSPPESDEISTIFDDNGYVRAGKNGKFCFYSIEGEKICDEIYDVTRPFYNGFAAVMREEKWTFIDEKGNEIFTPRYSEVEDFEAIDSGEAVTVAYLETEKGRLQAAVNQAGEEIVPLANQAIFFLGSEEDYRFIVIRDKTNHYSIRRFNGEIFTSIKFDNVKFDVNSEVVAVTKNGKMGVIGPKEVIIPFNYDHLYYDRVNHVYQAKNNGLWGLIKEDGMVLKDCVYTSMRPIQNGKMEVSKGTRKSGKYFYLTVDGKEEM